MVHPSDPRIGKYGRKDQELKAVIGYAVSLMAAWAT